VKLAGDAPSAADLAEAVMHPRPAGEMQLRIHSPAFEFLHRDAAAGSVANAEDGIELGRRREQYPPFRTDGIIHRV
jgi:hypothetical protein